MAEAFYQAAWRHYRAGEILHDNMEYDSAVCMLGFAAECVLKKVLDTTFENNTIKKQFGHDIVLLKDMIPMLLLSNVQLMSSLDSGLAFLIKNIEIPNVLFQDHPERRYAEDGKYNEEDSELCRVSTEQMMRELCSLYVDGYIDGK